MSDVLTDETPENEAAAEAPATDSEAPAGSVDSPEVVPASRFNGLMSRYNTDKDSWAAERQALEAEVSRLSAAREKETTTMSTDSDSGLAQEVAQLRELVARQALAAARQEAVAKYPAAAKAAHLLVGDPEDIERVAAELQSIYGEPTTATSDEVDADATDANDASGADQEPPVIGGAQSVDDERGADEAISAAVSKADPHNGGDASVFAEFWAAANRRAAEKQGADLTVG